MEYKNLKKQYRDLEMRVMQSLREKVESSHDGSQHIFGINALKVNVFDYTELVIVNDRLTFLDSRGYQYSVYSETSLEDLIDILTKTEEHE